MTASRDYTNILETARQARGTTQTAMTALQCLDLTSLNKGDTEATIRTLVDKGNVPEGEIAAYCVYPEFVATARQAGANNVATVINFPLGTHVTAGTEFDNDQATPAATPENTKAACQQAIADGAGEIDIVLDYAGARDGDMHGPMALLHAANEACYDTAGNRVPLKVIVESAAFADNDSLYDICAAIAQTIRPEFLKTSSGKHAGGGATLEAGAVLMDAAATVNDVGVKISGGVKTNDDCARYLALAQAMFGTDTITPAMLRFGASGVLDDLLAMLRNNNQDTAQTGS